jgi:hypothetical protein
MKSHQNQRLGPMPPIICVQPHCWLKSLGSDKQQIITVLSLALAGLPTSGAIGPSQQIKIYPQCEQCIQRVLNDGKAFLSQKEWDHLNQLGDWHRRRARRSYH